MKTLKDFNLTEKEKLVLQGIRNQGSYFYEAGGNEEVEKYSKCFFGWEIYKDDLGFDPSGVISSLVKKNVLSVFEDDGISGYCIKCLIEEDKNGKLIFN